MGAGGSGVPPGVELPAVSLYKIGDSYFVRDGNHRVSVAKFHKAAVIDAEVVEIRGYARKDAASSRKRQPKMETSGYGIQVSGGVGEMLGVA